MQASRLSMDWKDIVLAVKCVYIQNRLPDGFAHLAGGQVCLTSGCDSQVRYDGEKAGLPSLKYLHRGFSIRLHVRQGSSVAFSLLLRV